MACLVTILLAGCGTGGGGAAPDSDARLVLDGPWAGVDAGIASAIARGYDQAEGVTLHVRRGPVDPRALTDGRADFQVLDLNQLAGHRDLVAVMAIVQQPLLAYTTHAHQLATPWARRLARALHHPVRRWDLAPPRHQTHVEQAGVPDYPELVLATARQTLRDTPDLVRATVDALARGYRFTLTDPQSSAGDVPGDVTPQLARLNAAFVGAAGAPGVLDGAQIARWSAWAKAHGLPSAVNVETKYARAAASAGSG